MVAEVLTILGDRLDPRLKPWSSPNVRTTLRNLLRSGSVEVAYASLPFAKRWVRAGELRPDIEALAYRVRDSVADEEAASHVTRSFLERLQSHEDAGIVEKSRARLTELGATQKEGSDD
jgi:hypothetical protein